MRQDSCRKINYDARMIEDSLELSYCGGSVMSRQVCQATNVSGVHGSQLKLLRLT